MKIKVKVIPGSKKQEVIEMGDGTLRVKLCSQPLKGKANKELVELLASYYKVPKSEISIASGHTSKQKLVEVVSKII